jgi:threonine dehydratase
MSDISIALNREQIACCESLIRPYVRRTPIIQIDTADVGVNSRELCLKLELFQHSGSFKARGAFANLLVRKVPAAGVAPRRVATTERRSPMRQ